MQFSSFLNSRREACRELVKELGKSFAYVGILGSDVKSSAIRVNRAVSDIGEGSASECGFVIKMHNGRAFFEYSLDDVTGDASELAKKIVEAVNVEETLVEKEISVSVLSAADCSSASIRFRILPISCFLMKRCGQLLPSISMQCVLTNVFWNLSTATMTEKSVPMRSKKR